MKIFLIGMPGAGKSTIGKELALRKQIPFFDLDKEIEKEVGRSVTDIFSQSGESIFRKIEAETLSKITDSFNSFVMATGGGTPCFHSNMDLMVKTGFTVFMDPPLQVIEKRLNGTRSRPLLNKDPEVPLITRLENLLEKRLKYYKMAALRITDETILTDRIIQLLPNSFPD